MLDEYAEDLFSFAYIPKLNKKLAILAGLAERELWDPAGPGTEKKYPVLLGYLKQCFAWATERGLMQSSSRGAHGRFTCFNIGLTTPEQLPLYAVFERNRNAYRQPWCLRWFLPEDDSRLRCRFADLPSAPRPDAGAWPAIGTATPIPTVDMGHVVGDRQGRFPRPHRDCEKPVLEARVWSALSRSWSRVVANPQLAVPQLFHGRRQLLIPLCLDTKEVVDVAAVVAFDGPIPHVPTCLTLEMAYRNARTLEKPRAGWLRQYGVRRYAGMIN